MASNTGICGEQSCSESLRRRGDFLCLKCFREFESGKIDACPNCPGVYKPAQFPVCRDCAARHKPGNGGRRREVAGQPSYRGQGWGVSEPPVPVVSAAVTAAAERVVRNMNDYKAECANHEFSTIQYLVMPMLKGLGWDESDPAQVRREFKPLGKKRSGRDIAVDVALFDGGEPVVFIEGKRLDRDFDPSFIDQLRTYSASLADGSLAVLTNGKVWIVYSVQGAELVESGRQMFDISDPAGVARLNGLLSRDRLAGSTAQSAPVSAPQPAPVSTEQIEQGLRDYRDRERKRRGVPAFAIFKNDTIEEIAAARPSDAAGLSRIDGIKSAWIEQHGSAVLAIIRGRESGSESVDLAQSEESAGPASFELIQQALRDYRDREADRLDVPAYAVLKNDSILEIALDPPASLEDLGRIKGIGPATVEKHGAALLAIVRRREPDYLAATPVVAESVEQLLRKWGNFMSAHLDVSVDTLLSADVVREIVRTKPASKRELAAVSGIEFDFVAEHGDAILGIVQGRDLAGAAPVVAKSVEQGLWDWRNMMSEQLDVPVYSWLSADVVREIVRTKPASKRELAAVSGIEFDFVAEHGDAILAIVRGP